VFVVGSARVIEVRIRAIWSFKGKESIMRNMASLLIALMLAWGTGTAATAAVIFNNGPLGNNGFISDPDFPPSGGFSADDFTLAPGANVITDIHWNGLYAFTNTPQATDNFTIQFFANIGGAPALTPFLSLAIGNPGRTDTGFNTSSGSDIFAYSVDVAPIPLAANTVFWLSIVNDTTVDTDDNWFWSMQDAVGNSFARFDSVSAWTPFNNRHNFELTGPSAVPEPATLMLLAIGAVGLLSWRRKQPRSHC